jgi:hypothetical protein
LALLISIVLLQLAVRTGGGIVGTLLTWLGLIGLVVLIGLAIGTLVLIANSICRCTGRRLSAQS